VRAPRALASLEDLAEEATLFARRKRAPRTLKAYDLDWADFSAFCDRHSLMPLPAEPATAALYLTDLARRCKPSTIARRAAAISVVHKRSGHPSPTTDPRVQDITGGIRRSLGTAQREAAPATIGEIRRMVAHLPNTTLGARDTALLLVGFASAMRASELVALNVEDIEYREEGAVLIKRRSKTDQQAAGARLALPHGRDAHTCPVLALKHWLAIGEISDGPVFRAVDRHGRVDTHLSARAVSLIVKRAVSAIGLDPTNYSAHSLRAGFVTTAAANGASERAIANQTGHKSMEVLRRYVRHATVFTDNAATTLGL
jgi:integrase